MPDLIIALRDQPAEDLLDIACSAIEASVAYVADLEDAKAAWINLADLGKAALEALSKLGIEPVPFPMGMVASKTAVIDHTALMADKAIVAAFDASCVDRSILETLVAALDDVAQRLFYLLCWEAEERQALALN